MAYITTTDLKTYLSISGTSDDTLLSSLITRAQSAIDAYCAGRTFEAAADTTRYFDAVADTDGAHLHFDRDLCQITTVKNNADNGAGGVIVSSSQYATLPRNDTPYYAIRLLGSSGIAWQYTSDPESAIAVTGRWAYSVNAPADIQQACVRLSAFLYHQKDAVLGMAGTLENGGFRVKMDLPDDVRGLLEPYVRRV